MAFLVSDCPPCILHEDEHLLVVNKPAGWNTHAPAPHAVEGIYDWLRHREPRWASLAIIHRLDKETSGVMVFGKTRLANQSLTEQFASRQAQKKYLLQTDHPVPSGEQTIESALTRAGERYLSRPKAPGGELAVTTFRALADGKVEATPLTGKTHQIRVHAAALGYPILGDTLYNGTPHPRVCLHAASLSICHPASGEIVRFEAPVDFTSDARLALREAVIDPRETDGYRLINGAADGWPGFYTDRLGNYLLTQSEAPLDAAQRARAEELVKTPGLRGAYHKTLSRRVRGTTVAEASPVPLLGTVTPPDWTMRENGVVFSLSFTEGYSHGIFLDQRDNRRRLLRNHVAADFELCAGGLGGREVLNTFAYTCAFSVCAALAGARVTSLDLSRKYLDWGRRNFELNQLDPAKHDFIYGDVFDWCRRLAKKGRQYDVVILDPPTFSQSKESGVFRAEKDYGALVTKVLPLVNPGGVLLASTNAATLDPGDFVSVVERAIADSGRKVTAHHFGPQPPDFPANREEPGYLKTHWLRLD